MSRSRSLAAWQRTFGPSTSLTASGAYYEAFQRASTNLIEASERRDFRSLAPELRLQREMGDSFTLGISAGARWFVFKPDRDYDFYSPIAGADLRWVRLPDRGADWEATAGLGYEHRSFAGPALVDCPTVATAGVGCSGPDLRADEIRCRPTPTWCGPGASCSARAMDSPPTSPTASERR